MQLTENATPLNDIIDAINTRQTIVIMVVIPFTSFTWSKKLEAQVSRNQKFKSMQR
ncbi:hypothetical protein BDZ91DRAFT_115630 [Kalaharituber pfeilii]|nr:hypothetical protein BDZ91DRAFT_115630 [Kalaharituber pfeilii]